jgi:ubiquinone/menaquinone biosynthesis C-methylase UbiE
MSGAQLYDTIGATYTVTRRTEPRIAARIWAALGDARTVLNVGAGTGSYEPPGRDVTAVEPSALMRAQRPASAAPCVAAVAERLLFEDRSFDAAMAFSTIHHWQDPIAGLLEMRRVARRVVVFTCDTCDRSWRHRFWLTRDYLPEVADLVAELRSRLREKPFDSGPTSPTVRAEGRWNPPVPAVSSFPGRRGLGRSPGGPLSGA